VPISIAGVAGGNGATSLDATWNVAFCAGGEFHIPVARLKTANAPIATATIEAA
jgi:hypothetical protein